MRMSTSTYDGLNVLVGKCFDANAIFDNLGYSLDYHYYSRIAHFVHLGVAHVMPQWADEITDMMLSLSARPVRKDINGYNKDYDDIKEIFQILYQTLMGLRGITRDLIEAADLDGDDEVRIFCETFLTEIQPFIKQSEEWIDAANKLDANTLNIHIEDYTHFIPHP